MLPNAIMMSGLASAASAISSLAMRRRPCCDSASTVKLTKPIFFSRQKSIVSCIVGRAYLYLAINDFAVDNSCAPLKPRLSMSATHSSSICADSLTNSSRCAAVNW